MAQAGANGWRTERAKRRTGRCQLNVMPINYSEPEELAASSSLDGLSTPVKVRCGVSMQTPRSPVRGLQAKLPARPEIDSNL